MQFVNIYYEIKLFEHFLITKQFYDAESWVWVWCLLHPIWSPEKELTSFKKFKSSYSKYEYANITIGKPG